MPKVRKLSPKFSKLADLGTPPLLKWSKTLLLQFLRGSKEQPSRFHGGLKLRAKALFANRKSFLTNCIRGEAHKMGKRRDFTTTRTTSDKRRAHRGITLSNKVRQLKDPTSDCIKVGIIWSFSQNFHLTPWYPCFNLKVGVI